MSQERVNFIGCGALASLRDQKNREFQTVVGRKRLDQVDDPSRLRDVAECPVAADREGGSPVIGLVPRLLQILEARSDLHEGRRDRCCVLAGKPVLGGAVIEHPVHGFDQIVGLPPADQFVGANEAERVKDRVVRGC